MNYRIIPLCSSRGETASGVIFAFGTSLVAVKVQSFKCMRMNSTVACNTVLCECMLILMFPCIYLKYLYSRSDILRYT